MMAESLPFSLGTPVPTWELEAWYQDLQEVLSSDVSNRTDPSGVGQEQKEFDGFDGAALLWNLETSNSLELNGDLMTGNYELEPDLAAELLEQLGQEPPGPAESDSSHGSPTQTGTDDDEGMSTSRKRRQSGQPHGGKRQRGREREQQNERRVAELTAHNEHLQQEIQRLTAEVEATRAALIQRMVSLKT
ncbi:DNA damage-inducible transcript 3 protein isoform X1 [Pantherophis guttatus]|uniref:DNA damage-inducible transcript 3 protein isoform X1 n=1 Tax=Pantherophis guttatus TaxID=94885 RepID=A0A6P9BUP8_PANGU|nr:DNA damage-inducible transcript 3 protein isoform X1 [Pantherophis guttatus]XP_034275123.1 DNA damage-inducible transcript 3 protein isoform X1 [Pantherophis guttatus]